MRPVEEQAALPVLTAATDIPSITRWGDLLTSRLSTFLRAMAYRVNSTLPKDGSEGMAVYTVATRPTATSGQIIYVSDGGAGARFQGSHAGAWVNLG